MRFKKITSLLVLSTILAISAIGMTGCSSLGIRSIPLETLKEKYNVADTDFINVDGINIHYKDEGEGPVLVLLHGICASLYTWDGWVDQLKDRYRIIRLDVPGWGLTGPVGKDAYDRNKMITILEKFFDRLDIDTFYLAGNSLGGYFAWNYALEHPEQVKKMVLLDPVCYPQSVPWFVSAAKIPLIRVFPKYMMPKFLITMNVKAVYSDDSKITDEIYTTYFDMAMRKGNKSSYIDIFKFIAQNSKSDLLSKGVENIKTPTLLMYGQDDEWVSPDQAKLWVRDIPGIKHIIYDGVGHIPMEELPLVSAKDADSFFSEPETPYSGY